MTLSAEDLAGFAHAVSALPDDEEPDGTYGLTFCVGGRRYALPSSVMVTAFTAGAKDLQARAAKRGRPLSFEEAVGALESGRWDDRDEWNAALRAGSEFAAAEFLAERRV